MFESAEDARIPTPSTPSIEANGSDLVAIYVLLLDVGRRCAFREGNSGQRIHVGHDLPPRRLRQRRRDGSARLCNALRIDALVAPDGARRVGGVYWHVLGVPFESACGRKARHFETLQHRIERRLRARRLNSRGTAIFAWIRADARSNRRFS